MTMPNSRSGVKRLGLAFSMMVAAGAGATAADAQFPSEVSAVYRLSFNGFDVGKYRFNSRYDGKSYTAKGDTQVSALFGAFKWAGNFTGSGSVEGKDPQPASFEMSTKTRSKTTSVKVSFNGSRVASVALVPNKNPSPEAVKVKPENLRNVLDPMGATLAISSANDADACNRTIPVFDGKARYDLKLTPKGREPVKEKRQSGQPAELLVCQVKYVPIAGHKPKDFVNPWIDYDHIEIALRAVPSAGVYVPYRVTVPSTIGAAVMTVESINITAANNQRIALKQ
ncbi:DUF3108 domain-containing protein [Hyphomicrobium sp.]|uniref:DUF3108 domain-containing protein n=1 Tax=Hyphomicrobium sp. TaxID=82 RepID=UPI002D774E57|nr:DUF3108 domain-containing protein [Hyphomicrobium sp.]HET6391118.1 DUF3108 domain-containing protein [Hyphomicrobium sp.]